MGDYGNGPRCFFCSHIKCPVWFPFWDPPVDPWELKGGGAGLRQDIKPLDEMYYNSHYCE